MHTARDGNAPTPLPHRQADIPAQTPGATMTGVIEDSPFDGAADVVRGLVSADLGRIHLRPRRYGIKVWFGANEPPREHYEAQVIGADHVADARMLAIEIGFHAEHRKVAENDAVIARLVRAEARWRRVIGHEAVVGGFLGRADDWRRVSETWADPDLGDPELALEIGTRLTDYITAFEPLLEPLLGND